jgi:hypothetical protein
MCETGTPRFGKLIPYPRQGARFLFSTKKDDRRSRSQRCSTQPEQHTQRGHEQRDALACLHPPEETDPRR